jgi:hypothetical protein
VVTAARNSPSRVSDHVVILEYILWILGAGCLGIWVLVVRNHW